MADPLRSATSTAATTEDTSLALPSDHRLRTGQQRVLDQVHSIKRSKSKQGKGSGSGSPTSPLSPKNLSVFSEFGSFKFTPAAGAPSTATNGVFGRSATLNSKSVSAQKSRSLSTRAMGSRNRNASSSGQWDQQFSGSVWPQPPNGLKLSRSDPALALPLSPVPAPAPQMTTSNVQTTSSGTSQMRAVRGASVHSGSKVSLNKIVKAEPETSTQNGVGMVTLPLKDAVDYLSHPEEHYQLCGASFIQHCTFKDDAPKQEVLSLGGIPGLVSLLGSPSPEVSQSASAALRNLVFRDHDNKLEVQRPEVLGSSRGLLWNLSSSDELKGELIATALPVLTESVVVPFTCWSDSSANNNIHPDVFHSTTGCLRY
ncbi:hypothetical protein CRUP_016210 [Coryphaenoides rupestris]|nr:hypothetical protein CRUP_016210 [Coryphaenoides rupestris]